MAHEEVAVRIPPSGRQVEIVHGDQRVTVVEVGAGLRDYRVGDRPVLDGYAVAEQCTWGRGQLLLPWPNRIPAGRYTVDGRVEQLALTEPEQHNAIHGLTRWSAWALDQTSPDAVVAEHVLHPQPGYPFTLQCRASYRVGPDGLTVEMAVTNLSGERAPVGMGAHPYLLVGDDDGDGDGGVGPASVLVPATTRLLADHRGIPTGRAAVPGTGDDYRTLRRIGDAVLDCTYTDLVRDPDGVVRVRLALPDGPQVTLWADQTWPYLQVFTGDAMPEPQRRRSLAVEPMTCAPNAFNTGDGLHLLPPDDILSGTWGITVHP
jgi:aldose 1-epimerase